MPGKINPKLKMVEQLLPMSQCIKIPGMNVKILQNKCMLRCLTKYF